MFKFNIFDISTKNINIFNIYQLQLIKATTKSVDAEMKIKNIIFYVIVVVEIAAIFIYYSQQQTTTKK